MKNFLFQLFVSISAILVSWNCTAQETSKNQTYIRHDTLNVVSYNIENFFYFEDDSTKNDDDFTPEGGYVWTEYKMKQKAIKIGRVIASLNGWSPPEIVGICEIEGPAALDALLKASGLSRCLYSGICYPTQDRRGVSVALIYNNIAVKIIESHPINTSLPEQEFFTRDILYAKFTFRRDTFHIMVNHWPSKYGGESETVWKRNHVALRAKAACDSILNISPDAKIILLGDFNDTADAPAISEVLGATKDGPTLINLSGDTKKNSYKYRGVWSTIDHIIVSSAMCEKSRPSFTVCDLDFLLENDETNSGSKPYRTFIGMKYNGGYSDHLPVLMKYPMEIIYHK